ncbi:hypothetical protein CBOM_07669 [Ceraceosorus bombacis]|uniref:Uncharacterized protein n=1 Tax=Ceraceosorus bombacis TaxID=401625 RepID=A0A0P1BMQ0_9BASI|nr:hypothetical protein CBOM_07669 [Ceraceosorus bombacis]
MTALAISYRTGSLPQLSDSHHVCPCTWVLPCDDATNSPQYAVVLPIRMSLAPRGLPDLIGPWPEDRQINAVVHVERKAPLWATICTFAVSFSSQQFMRIYGKEGRLTQASLVIV